MSARVAILAGICCAATAGWYYFYWSHPPGDTAAKTEEARRLFAAGFRTASTLATVASPPAVARQVEKVRKVSRQAMVTAVREWKSVPAPARGDEPCLVRPGDSMQVRVIDADVLTEAGNRILVGRASVWVLTPPPGREIYAEDIDTALPMTYERARERDESVTRGWGVGPAVTATSRGVGYGVTVSSPPLSLKVLEITPAITATYAAGVTHVTLSAAVALYK